jgi:tetratricopeptide (TPR) repeat protein
MKIHLFVTTIAALAANLTCAAAAGESAGDFIQRGDALDREFKAAEALGFYQRAEKLEPKNERLLVRMARQYRHLMQDASKREEKIKLGAIALGYSLRAAALGPNDSEAQLSPAITYGKMLPLLDKREQIKSSGEIKSAAERAIKLDPRNDLAWHVLGRWHRVVAEVGGVKRAMGQLIYGSLPTTTNEEAVKCFNQAITINPNRLRHYIELGRTYAQMGRTADARKCIEKGLTMPDSEKDDPEIKRQGREALASLR